MMSVTVAIHVNNKSVRHSGFSYFEDLKQNFTKEPTIFVSVPSYRDVECKGTLSEIFHKAKNPYRIYVGVTEQNKLPDEACVTESLGNWRTHVRLKRFLYTEAKGVTFARYWCSMLYQGEAYYLQIDSHTKFTQDWDSELIRMMTELEKTHPKPMITHFPKSDDNLSVTNDVPVLYKSKFNNTGIPTFEATIKRAEPHLFYPSPFTAGEYKSTRGEVLTEVPFDPDLPFVAEEEILYSARFYTSGYDFFAPDKNIVYHHYIRADSPKVWLDNPTYQNEIQYGRNKIQYLLGISDERPPADRMRNFRYGMGHARTLAQYEAYCGIDFKNHTTNTESLFTH
jgi:hypothetical protein